MIFIYTIFVFAFSLIMEELLLRFLENTVGWKICIEACSIHFSQVAGAIQMIFPTLLSILFFLFYRKKARFKWLTFIFILMLVVNIGIAYLATDYGYARTSDPLAP
ncbi:MAG: hypothetical protein Q4D78_10640 [Neisseria zoodegmatis]|uniref:hypothetical protein n=1 Tax=Neisseria zoodegmatis TaxID=326523 RepID=UPI0026EE1C18|nr:hypothetical protein [Neisseria zoodegmatis]MDO5070626.1 hypothetical protein [Neisseria zoodegmatis]